MYHPSPKLLYEKCLSCLFFSASYYLRGQSTFTDRPIGISFLLCQGSENHVLDCYYLLDPIFFDPVHENDIGVICQPGQLMPANSLFLTHKRVTVVYNYN